MQFVLQIAKTLVCAMIRTLNSFPISKYVFHVGSGECMMKCVCFMGNDYSEIVVDTLNI